jgi:hypothetical protein
MTTNSGRSGSGVPAGADPQQQRVLEMLARHPGEPVTYDELRDAGIELPASVISEIELAGIEIDRCHAVRGGRRVTAVKLPSSSTPPQSAAPQSAARQSPAPQGPAGGSEAMSHSPSPESAPAPPIMVYRRRNMRLLAPLALLAVAAVIAVVVVVAADGKAQSDRGAETATVTHTGARSRPHTASAKRHRSHHSAAAAANTSSTAHTATGAASDSVAPAGDTSAGANLPGAAVLGFYHAAARHRYASAWALADPNMRAEVGGYADFEAQMTPVRAITFHELETLDRTPSSATVAVRTTSVQSTQIQQCSGTVRTVEQAGAWLLDGISIHCV